MCDARRVLVVEDFPALRHLLALALTSDWRLAPGEGSPARTDAVLGGGRDGDGAAAGEWINIAW
jgi:hypothetical protein